MVLRIGERHVLGMIVPRGWLQCCPFKATSGSAINMSRPCKPTHSSVVIAAATLLQDAICARFG